MMKKYDFEVLESSKIPFRNITLMLNKNYSILLQIQSLSKNKIFLSNKWKQNSCNGALFSVIPLFKLNMAAMIFYDRV